LLIFAITEFLLCLTPGPAVLLVISQGVKSGFKSSLKSAAGILTGNAIYFVLSALGLGALLMSSAALFQIIIEFLVLLSYGWAAERGSRLIPKGRFSLLTDRIAGGFLVSAGLGLAATRRL
jgi:threonine/homoserine/homoserine lactone efflux protein